MKETKQVSGGVTQRGNVSALRNTFANNAGKHFLIDTPSAFVQKNVEQLHKRESSALRAPSAYVSGVQNPSKSLIQDGHIYQCLHLGRKDSARLHVAIKQGARLLLAAGWARTTHAGRAESNTTQRVTLFVTFQGADMFLSTALSWKKFSAVLLNVLRKSIIVTVNGLRINLRTLSCGSSANLVGNVPSTFLNTHAGSSRPMSRWSRNSSGIFTLA